MDIVAEVVVADFPMILVEVVGVAEVEIIVAVEQGMRLVVAEEVKIIEGMEQEMMTIDLGQEEMVDIATMVVVERLIDMMLAVELMVVDIAQVAALTVVNLAVLGEGFVMSIVVRRELWVMAIAVVA